jgi:hypothetical protein
MRQFLYGLAKRLSYGGLLLIIAMSMGFVFSEVAQAQSDPNSCEVNPVAMRVPTNLFDSGVSVRVTGASNMDHAHNKLRAEIDKLPGLLACGSNHQEPFFTPPLQYSVAVDKIYIKSTSTIKHQTVIVSCLPMTRSDFPSNPDSDVATYMQPWLNFNSSQTFNMPADGVIRHNVEQVSKSFGFQSALTANGQSYPLTALSNMWMTNQWSVVNYDNFEVVYSKLIPNQAIAITYLEYYSSLSYLPKTDLSLSDQLRRELNSYMFVAGMQSLVNHTANLNVDQDHVVDGWSGDISFLNSIADAIADSMIAHSDGRVKVGGMLMKLGLLLRDPLTGFIEISDQISLAELQNLYPYQYGELYSMNEVSLDNRSSEVKNKLNQLGIAAPYTRLLAVRWHARSRILEVAGSGFNPRSSLFLQLRRPDNTVVKTITMHALSNGYYPQSSSYARSVYLDFGQLYTKFFFEPGASIPTGCYFLSALVWEQNQATVVTARAGNFVWIDGDANYVPPQSIIVVTSGSGSASPDRTCSNPVSLLTQHVNLFNGLNCSGDITWFSGHPENGPSANSSSMYVPANSIVKVSSNDNGGGDTACFNTSQPDLGAWRNRIQWTQLVMGGTCPVPPPVENLVKLFHNKDQQSYFRTINLGNSRWYNDPTQVIESIEVKGDVRAIFKHKNGAEECWDYSNRDLYGDWHLQTAWVEVQSGRCPGNANVVATFYVHDKYDKQDGWLDLITLGYFHMGDLNDNSNSMRFHFGNMSALLCKHANLGQPCFCRNGSDDYLRNNSFSDGSVVEDNLSSGFLFDNDSCQGTAYVPNPMDFAPGNNVQYRYYEYTGAFPGLPVSTAWVPTRSGFAGNFDLKQISHREDGFSVTFDACLITPSTGLYTFSTFSDDGSELYINGQKVVDNDGSHAWQERFGNISLTAGRHQIQVQFFEGGGGQKLGVSWLVPGGLKQWIPNSAMSQTGCVLAVPTATPTVTPIPTATSTVTPSNTPVPPTSTPLPTATPTSTATNTPLPTATPTVALGTFVAGSGVNYKYYEHPGNITSLPLSAGLTSLRTGVVSSFNLDDVGYRPDNFAVTYQACFNVPTAGQYTFITRSDDGSELYVDQQLVVDNDGSHETVEKSGVVNLATGVHSIEVQYFELGDSEILDVLWIVPGTSTVRFIPSNRLGTAGCSWGVVQSAVQSPTPTPTVTPTATPIPSATGIPTAIPTATATNTPVPPTSTSLPTATSTATPLPTATATSTPLATATPTVALGTFVAGSGVNYKYYEHSGNISSLPLSAGLTPVRTGVVGSFNLDDVGYRLDNFAVTYQACFSVPTAGQFTFITRSDDGSELYVDQQLVVDNDGSHETLEKSGVVNLTTGVHSIEVQYFELVDSEVLDVLWIVPGTTTVRFIPSNRLGTAGCSWGMVQSAAMAEEAVSLTQLFLPVVSSETDAVTVTMESVTIVEEIALPNRVFLPLINK